MGYLGNLVDDLGNRVKDFDVTITTNRDIAKRYINRAAKWVYSAHPWEWRFKQGQVTLIPNYTTGTCAVTGFTGSNLGASRTVNFSGSTLTSDMQGRYLKVDGDDYWHKIESVDVSNSVVYLDSEVTRTTASGLAFEIWKRVYYLPSNVAAITDFGRWNSRWGRLEYRSFSNLADQVADISDGGTPETFSPFGVDQYETSYLTGSVSGAIDTNILNGVGTSWVGNVWAGDEMVIGNDTYTVKRVEHDTKIVLNNYLPAEIPSATSYESRRNLSIGFQFYPNQIEDYMSVPYYFYDRIFDMVHETKDRPPLPDDFDDAILSRAEMKLKKDKGDSSWAAVSQLASAELDDLKINFRIAKPRYDIFAPEVRGYSGR